MRPIAAIVLALMLSFHALAAGQRGPTSSGGVIDLPNAIAGRVVDADGRPVPGTLVTLLQDRVQNGKTWLGRVGGLRATTNSRGEYRFVQLRPGAYYPVAFPPNIPDSGRITPARTGFAVTYHPGVPLSAEARPVFVNTRAVVTADIALVPARLYAVSGRILAAEGSPWMGKSLQIAHGDHLFGLDSKAMLIERDGTFRVTNLPKGSYCLQMHPGPWPPPRDQIPQVFGAKVTVVDRDLRDVQVRKIDMVRGSGRVVLPADRRYLPTSMQAFTVAAVPATVEDSACNPGPTRPGTLRSDLTFEFLAWPGMNKIRADAQGLPPNSLVLSVRQGTRDITATGTEFAPGRDVTGIEVRILARTAASSR